MLTPEGRWVTVQSQTEGEKNNNVVFSNEVYHHASADIIKRKRLSCTSFSVMSKNIWTTPKPGPWNQHKVWYIRVTYFSVGSRKWRFVTLSIKCYAPWEKQQIDRQNAKIPHGPCVTVTCLDTYVQMKTPAVTKFSNARFVRFQRCTAKAGRVVYQMTQTDD